jgi:hypothetical protein
MGKVLVGILIFIASFFVIAKSSVLIGMLILIWGKCCIIHGLATWGDNPEVDTYRRPMSATEQKHMRIANNRAAINRSKARSSASVQLGGSYSASDLRSGSYTSSGDDVVINPASGLVMNGGYGGLDAEGNTYGTDSHHDSF